METLIFHFAIFPTPSQNSQSHTVTSKTTPASYLKQGPFPRPSYPSPTPHLLPLHLQRVLLNHHLVLLPFKRDDLADDVCPVFGHKIPLIVDIVFKQGSEGVSHVLSGRIGNRDAELGLAEVVGTVWRSSGFGGMVVERAASGAGKVLVSRRGRGGDSNVFRFLQQGFARSF